MEDSTNRKTTPLRIAGARWTTPGIVSFTRHQTGEIAIEILDNDGQHQLVATVALVSFGAPHPGEYGVWLKDWLDNEGIPEELVRAGIVSLTGQKHRTGHAEVLHGELTEMGRSALMADLAAERARQATMVYHEIDALVGLGVLATEHAQRLKERLTPSVISSHMDEGLRIGEIIQMHHELLN